jgi:predicted glutamine amidotransferase
MCGIFGFITNRSVNIDSPEFRVIMRDLMRLSESRGKEAAGLALMNDKDIRIYKQAVSGAALFASPACRALFENPYGDNPSPGASGVAMIGHTRLATNGGLETHDNNQPVISSGMVGIHNGIVVNVAELWDKYPQLERRLEVDTEVILALLRHFLDKGDSLPKALAAVFTEIYGVANIALFLRERNQVVLATNNGSLYTASAPGRPVFAFASERHILDRFVEMPRHQARFAGLTISHLAPGHACVIDATTIASQVFNYRETPRAPDTLSSNGFHREIKDLSDLGRRRSATTRLVAPSHNTIPAWIDEAWEKNRRAIARLRRCARCVLPETVPFLHFDENGVCSDCRSHEPRTYLGEKALQDAVAPFRRHDGRADVLVPLSGGRDSCYSLHYIKKTLGLNPLAYTYDWGMVTDLARRNQSRMCSKLGVEHIWVSANIARKRENIRKNVQAWLRKPEMGLIPLFMAGDKQFFYYADKVAKQNALDLTIYAMNRLEYTDFKSGYCGIGRGVRADQQGSPANLKMVSYYLRAFLANPAYLNSSLADTAWAFAIYYLSPVHREYLIFEDFIPWDEHAIVSTLLGEYDWEMSPDTTTTWRIGDGTAPFYNYIYYTVGGFTEIDTFRSNQIRAGTIDRDTALALVDKENVMRYDSIQWYCETVGIDMQTAMRVINAIPKRYPAD